MEKDFLSRLKADLEARFALDFEVSIIEGDILDIRFDRPPHHIRRTLEPDYISEVMEDEQSWKAMMIVYSEFIVEKPPFRFMRFDE